MGFFSAQIDLERARILALCLIFITIDQMQDPLLGGSFLQESGYLLARVVALGGGMLAASWLVCRFPAKRWASPAWMRPTVLVTSLGILPLVGLEILVEPLLPLRPEFSDEALRAQSLFLAFVAEYATVATIVIPIYLLLWTFFSNRGPVQPVEQGCKTEALPDFLYGSGVSSSNQVVALKAEEHYVRVYTDMDDFLVHHRFSEAVLKMPLEIGLQVHRSWWVADSAIVFATRGSRRWKLSLCNELSVPVSESHMRSAQDRGFFCHVAEAD